jgi:hypothetical protein
MPLLRERLASGFRDLHAHDFDGLVAAHRALCARRRETSPDQSVEQFKREAVRKHDGPGTALRVFSEKPEGAVASSSKMVGHRRRCSRLDLTLRSTIACLRGGQESAPAGPAQDAVRWPLAGGRDGEIPRVRLLIRTADVCPRWSVGQSSANCGLMHRTKGSAVTASLLGRLLPPSHHARGQRTPRSGRAGQRQRWGPGTVAAARNSSDRGIDCHGW